jgi:hypothetical protein
LTSPADRSSLCPWLLRAPPRSSPRSSSTTPLIRRHLLPRPHAVLEQGGHGRVAEIQVSSTGIQLRRAVATCRGMGSNGSGMGRHPHLHLQFFRILKILMKAITVVKSQLWFKAWLTEVVPNRPRVSSDSWPHNTTEEVSGNDNKRQCLWDVFASAYIAQCGVWCSFQALASYAAIAWWIKAK